MDMNFVFSTELFYLWIYVYYIYTRICNHMYELRII